MSGVNLKQKLVMVPEVEYKRLKRENNLLQNKLDNQHELQDIDELRAELEQIKSECPSWDNAPEWAHQLIAHWSWQSGADNPYQPISAGYTIDYRPEKPPRGRDG